MRSLPHLPLSQSFDLIPQPLLPRGEGEQIPDYMLIIAPLPWERGWGEVGGGML